MSGRVLAVKQVIHPQRQAAEGTGTGNPPAHQVMRQVVGMGIRANRHAAPAVGADHVPVTEAGIRIDAPA